MIYEVMLEQNIKYVENTVFKFDSFSDASTFARLAIMGEPKTQVMIKFSVDEDKKEDE